MNSMDEIFGIAACRSRQQVLRFESALKKAGLKASVITTPRDVSIGCGLSVRFEINDEAAVRDLYLRTRPTNLIGFYQVHRQGAARPTVTPL